MMQKNQKKRECVSSAYQKCGKRREKKKISVYNYSVIFFTFKKVQKTPPPMLFYIYIRLTRKIYNI